MLRQVDAVKLDIGPDSSAPDQSYWIIGSANASQ
jgi:hypothetical protein